MYSPGAHRLLQYGSAEGARSICSAPLAGNKPDCNAGIPANGRLNNQQVPGIKSNHIKLYL